MIAVRIGLRIVRVAWTRSLLFVMVGAVACAALSTVVMAAQVKSKEGERRTHLVRAGEVSPQVSQRHTYRGSAVAVILFDVGERPAALLPGMSAPLTRDQMLLSPAPASELRTTLPHR